jgi:choline monooxygenase
MSAGVRDLLDLFDPDLPLERARTIPSCWYFDPEVYAAECRVIFGGTWQALGRTDQVDRPGAFFTADLAGEPVVVVRGDDGVLRAFFNVCRHHAARVVTETAGCATRLRCRYHGWTYDLAGRLRGTPEFAGVADFDREANGLLPLAVDTWGPLVWVHAGSAPPPLMEFLAPLPEKEPPADLERFRFAERREYVPRCNWKVFIDNFLDGGYHVNTIHPGLAGVLDYVQYRTEIAGNTSVQTSPLKRPDPSESDVVARVRSGGRARYWWVFPNFFASVYGSAFITSVVLPQGVDRCRVVCDFYSPEAEGPEARQPVAESIAVSDRIQQEDIDICEDVQRGLASRSYLAGRFSVVREAGMYHFHRLLAHRLRNGLAG